jgi:mono/diheme cytochrome c family protein
MRLAGTIFLALASLLCGAAVTQSADAPTPSGQAAAVPSPVDFARDVRPILAAHCYECHGPDKQKGALRLDSRAVALRGGVSGHTIVPGKSQASHILDRLRGLGGEDRMPFKKPPLTEPQIATLAAWIDAGAPWPDNLAGDDKPANLHWSFLKPVRRDPPAVKQNDWVRNPIDAFVLARLEKEGIKPSPEAPKETLLRRVSLDLTGLPPTPQEIDAFLSDTSPDAYDKQVERLLSSSAYGERWGRHWLDAARYADSNGYSHDNPRSIWKYRDWVVSAVNQDMPFDRFTLEQLAGDLLPNATVDDKVATGFHRNTQINTEGGIDAEQFRVESVIDRTNTTGAVWLGLTVGCAQCHNHKFDPIAQKEYYRFFAFFNNSDEPELRFGTPEDEARGRRIDQLEAELQPFASNPDDAAIKAKRAELAKLRKQEKGILTTLVIEERKTSPRTTHVLTKGDFTRPAEAVTPGVPLVLHPLNVENPTRVDLARWLTSADNPLTARVMVNRMWQQYFGHGLVQTENDFGTQGTPPTHPELLDWLATEFMSPSTRSTRSGQAPPALSERSESKGWSLKAMHRLIVTSSTYRQSSAARPDLATVDPTNKLLARQSRLRIDAEVVRDVALAASGLLSRKMGGPPVFPPQPEGVTSVGQVKHEWKESKGEDRYRRGLYTFVFRNSMHPLLGSFDAPDATSTCTRRLRSNTPLQALNLLNDEAFVEFAQALASRTLAEAPSDDAARVDYAFRLCTGRKPTEDERQSLLSLLEKQAKSFEASPGEAKPLSGKRAPKEMPPARFAAWVIVSRVLLNVDETITRE